MNFSKRGNMPSVQAVDSVEAEFARLAAAEASSMRAEVGDSKNMVNLNDLTLKGVNATYDIGVKTLEASVEELKKSNAELKQKFLQLDQEAGRYCQEAAARMADFKQQRDALLKEVVAKTDHVTHMTKFLEEQGDEGKPKLLPQPSKLLLGKSDPDVGPFDDKVRS